MRDTGNVHNPQASQMICAAQRSVPALQHLPETPVQKANSSSGHHTALQIFQDDFRVLIACAHFSITLRCTQTVESEMASRSLPGHVECSTQAMWSALPSSHGMDNWQLAASKQALRDQVSLKWVSIGVWGSHGKSRTNHCTGRQAALQPGHQVPSWLPASKSSSASG